MSKRQQAAATKYDPGSPRQTKREQVRQHKRKRALTWNVIVLGTAIAFLALIAWYVVVRQRPGQIPGEQTIPTEGAAEVPTGTTINYAHRPPSSGNHYTQAAPWGRSTAPVPEGTFVSNLAHGGVVLLYQCPSGCPDLEAQFDALLKQAPPDSRFNTVKILVTPYDGTLAAPVVALAWGRQLDLLQFDEGTLLRWYRRFVNLGPNVQA